MTEQEKINNEVKMELAVQDAKFKIFMDEMRDRDDKWAAEMREIRTTFKSIKAILQQMQTDERNHSILVLIGAVAVVVAVILK